MKISGWTYYNETIFKPDTMNVYTEKEFIYLNSIRFCFLGKSRKHFKEKLTYEKELPVSDGLAFLYNTGSLRKYCDGKINDGSSFSDENGCEYGVYKECVYLFPNFSKKGPNGVFLGTAKDTLNMKTCSNNLFLPYKYK